MVRSDLPRASLESPSFAADFDSNVRKTGFNAVVDTDSLKAPDGRTIQQVKEEIYTDLALFAALPTAVKLGYNIGEDGQRGYTPDGVEQSGALRELREHLMMARTLPPGHPLRQLRPMFYADNVLIAQIPRFVPNVETVLDLLDKLTLHTAEGLEEHLNLPFGTIASKLVRGQSFLRAHIYPAADEVLTERVLDNVKTVDGAIVNGVNTVDIMYNGKRINNVARAAPHPDTGYLTWLLGSAVGGLNILLADESVMPFATDPGSIVGNTADFIAQDIEGYHSVIHWVGMDAQTAMQQRMSLANFVHPRPGAYVGEKEAAVWLYERLHEIGYFGEGPNSVALRDRLILQARSFPSDDELVKKTLMWEPQAIRGGIIEGPEFGRYFHVTNPKNSAYERIPERPEPLIQAA